jgi:hypothetical protein
MLIKSPDDHRKRLRLLEELKNSDRLDDRQKDWLRNEYRRLAPGLAGERDAVHYLDLSFSGGENHAVLHDLRLEIDGQVAQIDHLIVNRLLMFYLLETKTYSGSLHINEHGEFMVEYANERRYGIESPLEQSRRHETVLKKTLEQLGITGRAGTEPTFVHVVMVHPKAIIKRPPADKFDTSMIIKADQFRTWHLKYVDAMSTGSFLAKTVNFRGRDTVKEWGELLKSAHRPTNPLTLPEFMKPKPIVPETKVTSPVGNPAEGIQKQYASSLSTATPKNEVDKPVCASCGKPLTPKAAKFCKDKAAWFGGHLYCYDHQAAAKTK